MNNKSIGLGVDVGGSHITSALVDLDQHRIIPGSRFRGSVNSKGTAAEVMAGWQAILDQSLQSMDAAICKVGIAMPGPFDYENGISLIKGNDKYEALYQMNVKELLASFLSVSPAVVRFSNDAGCFLKGELAAGPYARYDRVVGLTLGTGLGTALCQGSQATDTNRWCLPFLQGIAEEYISTRWFLRRFEALTNEPVNGVKELADLYDTNELVAVVFDEFAGHLSLFISICVEKDAPDLIVLGGNIAKAAPYFLPKLETLLQGEGIHVPLRLARLGEDAPIIGALV